MEGRGDVVHSKSDGTTAVTFRSAIIFKSAVGLGDAKTLIQIIALASI